MSEDRHDTKPAGSEAQEELLRQLYDELRTLARARMASEAPGHTLQATALVHEMILVTRNVRDVARTGVEVVNPFAG